MGSPIEERSAGNPKGVGSKLQRLNPDCLVVSTIFPVAVAGKDKMGTTVLCYPVDKMLHIPPIILFYVQTDSQIDLPVRSGTSADEFIIRDAGIKNLQPIGNWRGFLRLAPAGCQQQYCSNEHETKLFHGVLLVCGI